VAIISNHRLHPPPNRAICSTEQSAREHVLPGLAAGSYLRCTMPGHRAVFPRTGGNSAASPPVSRRSRRTNQETLMAKGQKKSNREAKKPKASKKPAAGAVDPKRPLTAKFTSLKADK
jgi:hypothetical protein